MSKLADRTARTEPSHTARSLYDRVKERPGLAQARTLGWDSSQSDQSRSSSSRPPRPASAHSSSSVGSFHMCSNIHQKRVSAIDDLELEKSILAAYSSAQDSAALPRQSADGSVPASSSLASRDTANALGSSTDGFSPRASKPRRPQSAFARAHFADETPHAVKPIHRPMSASSPSRVRRPMSASRKRGQEMGSRVSTRPSSAQSIHS